jgi:imidazolonepropionase
MSAVSNWDLLLRHASIATFAGDGYGIIDDGALVVRDGAIAWIGADRELPGGASATQEIAAEGRWISPDSSTPHASGLRQQSRQ